MAFIPLIGAVGMRAVGQRLLDALETEARLYQADLPDEDFEQWKAARKIVEQLAIDYSAIVHLYLEAVPVGLRPS